MKSYNVCTVIVSFNSEIYIRKCLDSAVMYSCDNSCIIIIDNASTDSTVEILERYIEERCVDIQCDIILIKNEVNKGFGQANNDAFEHVNADYYFLQNVDAYLVGNSVNDAIAIMEHYCDVGVVGLPLVFPDGAPQSFCYSFSNYVKWSFQIFKLKPLLISLLRVQIFRHTLLNFKQTSHVIQGLDCIDGVAGLPDCSYVDWVCGASMLLTKRTVNLTGGFDSGMFMYAEDEDLCIQAKKLGIKTGVVNVKPVVHEFGWGQAKKKLNHVVMNYKYDSLKYFVNKNVEGFFDRFIMLLILPIYVFGFKLSFSRIFNEHSN